MTRASVDNVNRVPSTNYFSLIYQKVSSVTRSWRPSAISLSTWGIFAFQSIALFVEANTIYSRGELTEDYAVFGPAVASISHFHLAPHVLLADGRGVNPFIENHFEWITWPLSIVFGSLMRIPPWVILLVILQAIPTALIGLLGSYYARSKAKQYGLSQNEVWAVALLPSLLALTNIWLYWDSRFDFHFQAFQACLVVGIILAVEFNRDLLAIIIGILLMGTGETAATLFIPILLFLLLRRKLWGAALATIATVATLYAPKLFNVPTQAHFGFAVSYQYLIPNGPPPTSVLQLAKLILIHPLLFLSQIWSHRLDVWSELSASGFVGLASPVSLAAILALGIPVWGTHFGGFAGPIFQTIAIVQFPIFASGVVLILVVKKSWLIAKAIWVFSIVWSVIWLVIFGPVLVRQLVNLSSTQVGHAMQNLDKSLPSTDIILTTNAAIGDFPNHEVEVMGCAPIEQLPKAIVDVVIDPWYGIQNCGPFELLQQLTAFAALPGSVLQGPTKAGVFVVKVDGLIASNRRVAVRDDQSVPANFLIAPDAKHGHVKNSAGGSYVVGPPGGGFVVEGIVADVRPRRWINVDVSLSVNGAANVQIWNDDTGTELAQAYLVDSKSETVELHFNTGRFSRPPLYYTGFGIFSTEFISPPRLNPIEIRITNTPGSKVQVKSIRIS